MSYYDGTDIGDLVNKEKKKKWFGKYTYLYVILISVLIFHYLFIINIKGDYPTDIARAVIYCNDKGSVSHYNWRGGICRDGSEVVGSKITNKSNMIRVVDITERYYFSDMRYLPINMVITLVELEVDLRGSIVNE